MPLPMNYCSYCGSDQLVIAVPAGDNRKRIVCRDCQRVHYINPRVIVGTLPIFESKALLCRRAIEPRKGLWNLPCGFLENNETTREGAIRETVEESRAEVQIVRLHCVFDLPHYNQVYMIFLAEMYKEEFGVTAESTEVKLFKQEEIPWEQMAFASTEFALQRYFSDPEYTGVHMGSYRK
ncbi:MAG: NUDIX domain-containing protein [Flavobacteriales bacterium]